MNEHFRTLFGDIEAPHFIIPKEIFTNKEIVPRMQDMIEDLCYDVDKGKVIPPPFETFFVTSWFFDEDHLREPKEHIVLFSNVRRVSDGIIGNHALFMDLASNQTCLFDMGTKQVFILKDGKTYKSGSMGGEDDGDKLLYDFSRKRSRCAFDMLTILLSMETEQRFVKKILPKKGTSAQRKKAPDRYATEIHLEFTPELKRIISERSETTNKGSGGTKSPHMRRGFIKTQRYGPKLSKVKEIFIEAVHVNKDKGPSTPKQTYRFRVTDQNQGLTV